MRELAREVRCRSLGYEGHIFISYPRIAEQLAISLALSLKGVGCPVWIDLEDLDRSRDVRQQLESAIRQASVFVVLLDSARPLSEWVDFELQLARSALGSRAIVVAHVKGCTLSQAGALR